MEKKIILEGDNFIATKLIGIHSSGKVYLGETKDTKKTCAIKKINLKKDKSKRNTTLRQIRIMKKIKHENCVDLFFIEPKNYQKADLIYIVMEYCSMGDLNQYLKSKTNISIEEVKEMLGQIVKGLKYLYQKDILHRNLKPGNILLQSNDNSEFGYTIKIADFGFARMIRRDDLGETIEMDLYVGTPLYVAPEILSNKPYTSNVDLWSLGAILYEIITGYPPFEAENRNDLENQLKKATKKSLPKEYLKIIPKECNDLVERLLTVDPHSRIKREELYKHPFIPEELKKLINENSKKKIFGIAKIDSQNDDDDLLSFSKGDKVKIIEIDGEIGIGKLNGKEGEIYIDDFDIKKK